MNPTATEEAWWGLGQPATGMVLIVGDHASNCVPSDIDLGIDPALMDLHIARDIGVTEVAQRLIDGGAAQAAFLAGVSRLVIDLNREVWLPDVIPASSDGYPIPGNVLDPAERQARIERFHHSYHAKLEQIIAAVPPLMILSLHSFTPSLCERPDEARPWHIGVLYNTDDRLARIAIPVLTRLGLHVGDQLPYSGRDLNYTMNRHAEAKGIPYLGIEMRQDLVGDPEGAAKMSAFLAETIAACRNYLAQEALERQANDAFWNLE